MKQYTDSEWSAIPDKDRVGIPEGYHVVPDAPEMTIEFYPIPDGAYRFTPWMWRPLGRLAIGDTLNLPSGYERAMRYGLAVEMAPEYEKDPSALVISTYTVAKANIKRMNCVTPDIKCDDALLIPGIPDIRTGTIR